MQAPNTDVRAALEVQQLFRSKVVLPLGKESISVKQSMTPLLSKSIKHFFYLPFLT